MKRYVVDASVLVEALTVAGSLAAKEWECLMEEARHERAELWSSGMMHYELANFFSRQPLGFELSQKFLQDIREWPILTVCAVWSDVARISSLARKLGASAYSVSYHLLALENDATFLTLDRQYFAKAKDLGSIRLLAA